MAEGFLEIQTIIANGIEVYPTPNSVNAIFGETVQVHIDFQNIGEWDTFLWEARDQYNNLLDSQDIPGIPPGMSWEGNFSFEMPSENITIIVKTFHQEEFVKFRTSDLTYGSGSIALNTSCDGGDLIQYNIHSIIVRSHITSGDYCVGSVLTNLPGDISGGTSTEPVQLYGGTYGDYCVCQKDGTGGRWQTQYPNTPIGTESATSIDPSREIIC